MAQFLDRVKKAGKNVVDAGAKTMLKVRNRESWDLLCGFKGNNDDSLGNGSKRLFLVFEESSSMVHSVTLSKTDA